jgi:hypothetical protein
VEFKLALKLFSERLARAPGASERRLRRLVRQSAVKVSLFLASNNRFDALLTTTGAHQIGTPAGYRKGASAGRGGKRRMKLAMKSPIRHIGVIAPRRLGFARSALRPPPVKIKNGSENAAFSNAPPRLAVFSGGLGRGDVGCGTRIRAAGI